MKKKMKLFFVEIGMLMTSLCMMGCGRETDKAIFVEKNVPYISSPASFYTDYNVNLVKTPAISTNIQEEYTFAWMTDTQFYSENAPEVYEAMTKWISENADDRNIKFVFHTGDVVDETGDSTQWLQADAAMGYLDGSVPYSILAGNHDLTDSGNSYENFLSYFGADRFSGRIAKGDAVWFYREGEASAQMIDTGSQSYLVLAYIYALV